MDAIGLIEVIGYVAAIEASDACLKSANVNIVSIDKVGTGIVTLTICGDVAAVKSALESGEMAASKVGILRASHIIPRIHSEVADILFKKEEVKVHEISENIIEDYEDTLDLFTAISEKEDKTLDNTKINNENLYSNTNNINKERVDINLTEVDDEKIDVSNIYDKEVSEEVEIENSDFNKDDLSKNSVKELKAMAKKLDSSITYRELNLLKKEELINLVKKLNGEDR